jgi:hypothetical protein
MPQYKTAVEDHGLATYLISGDLANPDPRPRIFFTPIMIAFIGGLVLSGICSRFGRNGPLDSVSID